MATRPFTAGTATAKIAADNPRRTALSFINNGAADIFLSQDQSAVTTNGYVVAAGNGLDLIRALGDEPQTEWYVQTAAVNVNVRVLEAFGQLPVLFTPGVPEEAAV